MTERNSQLLNNHSRSQITDICGIQCKKNVTQHYFNVLRLMSQYDIFKTNAVHISKSSDVYYLLCNKTRRAFMRACMHVRSVASSDVYEIHNVAKIYHVSKMF